MIISYEILGPSPPGWICTLDDKPYVRVIVEGPGIITIKEGATFDSARARVEEGRAILLSRDAYEKLFADSPLERRLDEILWLARGRGHGGTIAVVKLDTPPDTPLDIDFNYELSSIFDAMSYHEGIVPSQANMAGVQVARNAPNFKRADIVQAATTKAQLESWYASSQAAENEGNAALLEVRVVWDASLDVDQPGSIGLLNLLAHLMTWRSEFGQEMMAMVGGRRAASAASRYPWQWTRVFRGEKGDVEMRARGPPASTVNRAPAAARTEACDGRPHPLHQTGRAGRIGRRLGRHAL